MAESVYRVTEVIGVSSESWEAAARAAGEAPAQITDIGAAINKAGRERMLSQRIAKAYFQLGQGIDPERAINRRTRFALHRGEQEMPPMIVAQHELRMNRAQHAQGVEDDDGPGHAASCGSANIASW